MLKKSLKYVFLDAKLCFKMKSTYRAATILKLFMNIFLTITFLFLWNAIYYNNTIINNFSLQDTLTYIIILRACRCLYPYNIAMTYANMVKNGKISLMLLKPIPLELQFISKAIGNSLYDFCYCSLPSLLLIPLFCHNITISIFRIPYFLICIIGSYIFIFLFEMVIGVLSYHTKNLWGINIFKTTIVSLLSGEFLPISFYPKWLLNIIYKLPFSSIYFIPISIILNKPIYDLGTYIFILTFSICLLTVLYFMLSRKMIKHITIQGG